MLRSPDSLLYFLDDFGPSFFLLDDLERHRFGQRRKSVISKVPPSGSVRGAALACALLRLAALLRLRL